MKELAEPSKVLMGRYTTDDNTPAGLQYPTRPDAPVLTFILWGMRNSQNNGRLWLGILLRFATRPHIKDTPLEPDKMMAEGSDKRKMVQPPQC